MIKYLILLHTMLSQGYIQAVDVKAQTDNEVLGGMDNLLKLALYQVI